MSPYVKNILWKQTEPETRMPTFSFHGAVAPLGSSLSQRQTLMKPSFITIFLAKRLVPVDPGRGYSGKRAEPSMRVSLRSIFNHCLFPQHETFPRLFILLHKCAKGAAVPSQQQTVSLTESQVIGLLCLPQQLTVDRLHLHSSNAY